MSFYTKHIQNTANFHLQFHISPNIKQLDKRDIDLFMKCSFREDFFREQKKF